MNVDLPDPDGPMTPRIRPRSMARLTSFSTGTAPASVSYCLYRCSVRMSGFAGHQNSLMRKRARASGCCAARSRRRQPPLRRRPSVPRQITSVSCHPRSRWTRTGCNRDCDHVDRRAGPSCPRRATVEPECPRLLGAGAIPGSLRRPLPRPAPRRPFAALRRPEPQRGIGHEQDILALRDDDVHVGGHARHQDLVRILHGDHDVVGHDVLLRRRVEPHLPDARR